MLAARRKSPVMEIARLAGVSKAAAYAALNPGTSGNIGVGDEARKRILSAAAEVGYVKNELASSLVTGRTNTIGVCVQSLRNNFFGGFLSVLDSYAYPAGYAVMISSSEYDSERELRNIGSFIAKRVDALVVAYADFERFKACFEARLSYMPKLVSVGDGQADGAPCVCFDERAAARLQARHLLSRGRGRAAHLNGSACSDRSSVMHRNRALLFKEEWAKLAGVEALEFQSSNVLFPDPGIVDAIAAKARAGEIDSVVCSADTLAMGLISALTPCGVGIPEELSIVGLDDLDYSSGFFIPLSTVRLPVDRLAEEVWTTVRRLLDGEPYEALRKIQPELVVRKSS